MTTTTINGDKLSKIEYLYGTTDIVPMDEAFRTERIQNLENNLNSLIHEHYLGRDTQRINAILKAIDFYREFQ